MKNNIILILVVTIISIAVIVISIAVSVGNGGGESSSPSGESVSEVISTPTTPTAPEPESSAPETTTSQTESLPPSEPERVTDEQTAGDIIALARSLIGTEFAEGGDTPEEGFDNSGFIYYVLRENGYITCPRGVSAQSEMGAALEYDQLKPGDLVFFSESGAFAEFGGIYAGDGIMIACLMPGTQVKEVNITTSYYTAHFYRGVVIA
ncbi:MAG: C40 family peptidase [Oscillospiraceae bacterium]|nr:C40 family peptidase [Oscillospiraceae bacterium]